MYIYEEENACVGDRGGLADHIYLYTYMRRRIHLCVYIYEEENTYVKIYISGGGCICVYIHEEEDTYVYIYEEYVIIIITEILGAS